MKKYLIILIGLFLLISCVEDDGTTIIKNYKLQFAASHYYTCNNSYGMDSAYYNWKVSYMTDDYDFIDIYSKGGYVCNDFIYSPIVTAKTGDLIYIFASPVDICDYGWAGCYDYDTGKLLTGYGTDNMFMGDSNTHDLKIDSIGNIYLILP